MLFCPHEIGIVKPQRAVRLHRYSFPGFIADFWTIVLNMRITDFQLEAVDPWPIHSTHLSLRMLDNKVGTRELD